MEIVSGDTMSISISIYCKVSSGYKVLLFVVVDKEKERKETISLTIGTPPVLYSTGFNFWRQEKKKCLNMMTAKEKSWQNKRV